MSTVILEHGTISIALTFFHLVHGRFSIPQGVNTVNTPARVQRIVIGILIFLSVGCGNPQRTPIEQEVADVPAIHRVEQIGAMKDAMRSRGAKARVRLVDVVATPHAFAVGALEGLSGEVTIEDGNTWVSRVSEDGDLVVSGPETSKEDNATLLTIGYASDWHRTTIKTVATGKELESLIERTAKTQGIDTLKPFPFRIEGELTSINLHVINGYCPIATDPATQEKKPWRWANSEPTDVHIVGFYAPNAATVMTHHGTSIHAHAIVMADDRRIIGHIDSVTVEPGMTLLVPSR